MSAIAATSAREAFAQPSVNRADGPDTSLFALDVLAVAVRDPRVDDEHLRAIVQMLTLVFRPTLGGRLPIDRTFAAQRWIENIPERPLAHMPRLRYGGHLSAEEEPEPMSPKELAAAMKAVALDRGIATGKVTPLDREASAKFIRESYAAARRSRDQEE